jgi:hypothetical protein
LPRFSRRSNARIRPRDDRRGYTLKQYVFLADVVSCAFREWAIDGTTSRPARPSSYRDDLGDEEPLRR